MRIMGAATHRSSSDLFNRRRSPALRVILALALGVGISACKKDSGESKTPTATGGDTAEASNSAGVTLRYNIRAQTLKKNVKGSFRFTSGRGGGSVSADLTGLLTVNAHGDDGLKVSFSVTELRDYTSEMPQPPGGETPAEPKDPKVIASAAKGATIINTRGEADEDKTKALPENDRSALDPEAQGITEMVAGFLTLPELPEGALEIGKPLTSSKEKDVPGPGGLKIPSEIDTTIKLLSIDDSSGKRIATIEIETEGSGAVETQGTMISLESSTEQTLVFNLDDMIPVSAKVQSTNAFSFGPQGSFELNVQYESSFEPG
jgi:hypothetical protein